MTAAPTRWAAGCPPGRSSSSTAVRPVDYCSACGLLIPMSAWLEVDGFDDAYYPAYHEDVDLCLTLRAAGYRVIYAPEARLRHRQGASAADVPLRSFAAARNGAHFCAKWSDTLAGYDAAPKQRDRAEAVDMAVRHGAERAVPARPVPAQPVAAGPPPTEIEALQRQILALQSEIRLKDAFVAQPRAGSQPAPPAARDPRAPPPPGAPPAARRPPRSPQGGPAARARPERIARRPQLTMTTPDEQTPPTATETSLAERFDASYYAHHCSEGDQVPYERSAHWVNFFASVASRIRDDVAPRTALDVGCAHGFLVESLRDKGIDASGFDVSEFAISQVREDIRAHCRVASVLDPIEGRYDLVTCIEVLEHLPQEDADRAVANICAVTDDVIFELHAGRLPRGHPRQRAPARVLDGALRSTRVRP